MKNEAVTVITGLGAITPLGCSLAEMRASLQRGEPAVRDVTLFDCPGVTIRRAAELAGFKAADYLGAKGLRFIPRSGQLLQSALKRLAQESGVPHDETGGRIYAEERIGLVVGATFGSLDSISRFDRESLVEPQYVNPMAFPNTVINAIAGYAAIRYGIRGFTVTVSNGFVSGTDALGLAAEYVSAGRADCVCAGGVEELCGPTALGLEKSGRLGSGFMGEGCAMFALETEERACRRSATILGEIAGYDARFDPDVGRGLAAGLSALEEGGLSLNALRWALISPNAEVAEIQRAVLGKRSAADVLNEANQIVGECYSAQGALQAAAVLADERIKPGEAVLLSAADLDGGVSQLVLRKR